MRYSLMLQLIVTITLLFVNSAAMFAWLQCRPGTERISTHQVSAIANK